MALGAITFSALTVAFDRSHHRKSIRPFCNVYQNFTSTELCISIENAGMGPMLIHTILLLNKHDDPIQTGVPLTKELFSEFYDNLVITDTDKYVLAPSCRLILIQSTQSFFESEGTPLLLNKLNGHCLYVKYADVYDDTYEKRAILTL